MPPPTIPPRPSKDPKDAITRRAERCFSARGSRTAPGRAKALLLRLGTEGEPREDDRLDAPDEP